MGKAAKEQEKEGFGMHFGKSDLVRIGLFSESPGIVGDTYNDKKGASALDGRAKGKQFLTSPAKKGHDSKDAYFQKDFGRVFENEPYSDIVALRRKWRAEAKEKNISAAQFRPSGVPPKPYF